MKNKDFGFKILEKGHILRPFPGIAPTKNEKFKGVMCLFIYISQKVAIYSLLTVCPCYCRKLRLSNFRFRLDV